MAAWEWTPERLAAARTHYPEARTPPPPGLFEIALACAGATSTAAYTAGVLDFLFEAFDEWERLKREQPSTVPHHKVMIRAFVGTSGGGMSLAIAAANAARDFKPVAQEDVQFLLRGKTKGRNKQAVERLHANPLFASWVLGIDLMEGFDPLNGEALPGLTAPWSKGRTASQAPSLFNCEIIETLATSAIMVGKPGVQGEAKARPWLADPLELRLTVTNLNGVAYDVSFGGARLAQTFLAARDEMAFAVETGGTRPPDLVSYASAEHSCPPDCAYLARDASDRSSGPWRLLSLSAMATGALPVALETRTLTQPRDVYLWRTLQHNGTDTPGAHMPRWWDEQESSQFMASDGGFTHDPPFEYARQRLAGVKGRNPRDGREANRALILIDPLLGAERLRDTTSLVSSLFAMMMAPVEQARMDASAALGALDEKVYSRFMISPRRSNPLGREQKHLNGSFALVAAGVQAFLGFVSVAYRAHDFLLGRRNAQKFLSDSFVVPDGNPILTQGWTDQCKALYRASGDGPVHYQIVPLCGSARKPVDTPAWPAGAVKINSSLWKKGRTQLRTRFKSISQDFASELAGPSQNMARMIAPWIMDKLVATTMIDQLEKGVQRVNDNLPAVEDPNRPAATTPESQKR
jgi:hypothetical protein